ncbi:MAG: SSU ribosomal protein S7p (S5e) [Parcubacteria group bacterium Gr01-1014_72]|jgi:small subunit ribosomal protein S7|nr:MAG: SSU ribosomal protein S7p (S5e) [Parcubacteria group bacterium Gr01-1014_72]
MRRKAKVKHTTGPDPVYNSVKVAKLMNYVMKKGEKAIAREVVYRAFDLVKEQAKTENPLEVYELALKNTGPLMEVRSRRVGGANYQVPVEVRAERRLALSLRWILAAVRAKKGQPMIKKLASELVSASKNEGEAVKKRENVHKMAEANKAFAHFAW